MPKIVINKCFGGFGLSKLAQEKFASLKNIDPGEWEDLCGFENIDVLGIYRADPDLVKVVQELVLEANDKYSDLKIVDVPDNIEWEIHEYDGAEWVAEKHRTWA